MAKKQTGKTVLVIEDEINIQNFLARVLGLEGYDVFQTLDGATGMEILRKDPISLVLLDLRLPNGLDGWSVLRQIKRDPGLAAIPVVVLTASAEAAQRRRTLRMGATNYLVKPVSARLLIQTVRDALRRKAKSTRTGRTASLITQ
jgi:DNA-binding response OmpR family regulator